MCLCETLTWKSYLSTAGESVVPAHKVFGRVHTSQVFARYSHAPVSLCTITLSHNLQSSTETDDYFSHVYGEGAAVGFHILTSTTAW